MRGSPRAPPREAICTATCHLVDFHHVFRPSNPPVIILSRCRSRVALSHRLSLPLTPTHSHSLSLTLTHSLVHSFIHGDHWTEFTETTGLNYRDHTITRSPLLQLLVNQSITHSLHSLSHPVTHSAHSLCQRLSPVTQSFSPLTRSLQSR